MQNAPNIKTCLSVAAYCVNEHKEHYLINAAAFCVKRTSVNAALQTENATGDENILAAAGFEPTAWKYSVSSGQSDGHIICSIFGHLRLGKYAQWQKQLPKVG